ncbi:MAG: hypothetical protein HON70_04795, partial [Lentisphaerae bacterium]|nr:hypothetical protein [Lentisphaerota bacterium]
TAEGVDVQGTVDRVKEMVRKAYQADLREQAAREQSEASARAQAADARVAAMSLADVVQMLRSQAAALAFFRDKSPDECSEQDLRSLLADIMAAEESDAEAEDT